MWMDKKTDRTVPMPANVRYFCGNGCEITIENIVEREDDDDE